tara:strand:+ start:259 stop:414 length:156 start_codon:yes stop_codon:yes gene_type:complete
MVFALRELIRKGNIANTNNIASAGLIHKVKAMQIAEYFAYFKFVKFSLLIR